MTESKHPPPAITARRLMRACATATLATVNNSGWPYGSLVLVAADHDASPILLISTLAEHTKNLLAESRASLLFDGTAGLAEPLTGARVTVLGRAERTADPQARARFLARHPGAAMYADFGDFAFYRLAVERGHLVAGFGRIHWIDDLLWTADTAALAAAEADVVAHMNADHAEAVKLYATKLLGQADGAWRLTGCDAEGCDLMADGGARRARLDFDKPVADAEGARVELVRLVKRARTA